MRHSHLLCPLGWWHSGSGTHPPAPPFPLPSPSPPLPYPLLFSSCLQQKHSLIHALVHQEIKDKIQSVFEKHSKRADT